MPLLPNHAVLLDTLDDPSTHSALCEALSTGTPRARLPLATAVCRAAQAKPSRESQKAWRLAIAALKDLTPALSKKSTNGATSTPSRTAVETYSALYALAISCTRERTPEEAADAQRIAADALRSAFHPAGRPSARRAGDLCVKADPEDLDGFDNDDCLFLDRVVFLGAADSDVHRLLPSSSCSAPAVVVPALLARITDADASLSDKVATARWILQPWLRVMATSAKDNSTAMRSAEAYRRKARLCLQQCADDPEADTRDAFEARVMAASICTGQPEEFCKAVLRAANSFLRSGGTRDYDFVASIYSGAVSLFESRFDLDRRQLRELHSHQDVAAWFDHVLISYSTAREDQFRREALSLAKKLSTRLSGTSFQTPAELQLALVQEGLYTRDYRQWPGISTASESVERLTNAWLLSVEGSVEAKVSACALRILRVLEPVRSALASIGKKVIYEPNDLVRLHNCYPAVLVKALQSLATVTVPEDSFEAHIRARLRGMIGAALTVCESLLEVFTTTGDGSRIHDVLEHCRILVCLSERSTFAKWSRWLVVMLNNMGVDTYNRHVKRIGAKDLEMMRCAAILMRTSARWLTIDEEEGVSDGSMFDFASCICRRVSNENTERCLKRLAFAADAHLASGAKADSESLHISITGLHLCVLSEISPLADLAAAFSRAAAQVANRNPDELLSALFDHCPNTDNQLSFVELALSSLRRYTVESLQKGSISDLTYRVSEMRSRGLLVGQQKLLSWMDDVKGSLNMTMDHTYLLQRLNVALGISEGLSTARNVQDHLAELEKSQSSQTRAGRNRSSRSPPGKEKAGTSKFFFDLVHAWVKVEGLDLSSVSGSYSHLESAVAELSALRLDTCFLWHHIIELGEWMASILELYDVDVIAIECWHIVRRAYAKLGARCSGFGLANLYRKLGWSEQCLITLRSAYFTGSAEDLCVHAQLLNDSVRFEDAEIVLSGRREAVCCAVRGDTVLFGRGDIVSASRQVKDALKATLKNLSSGSSEESTSESADFFRVGGVSILISAVESSRLDRLAAGRFRRKKLFHVLDCLTKLGSFQDRADCISDARYYAQKAVELSSLLGSPSLRILCLLRTIIYPRPVLGSAEEDNDAENVLALAWGEDAEIVNPLTTARVLMTKGDAGLADIAAKNEVFKSSTTSFIRDMYDEAADLLDYQSSISEVDSDIVMTMTVDLITKRGLLFLHEENYSSARDTFIHALSFSSRSSRETQLVALMGIAESEYRCGRGRDAISYLRKAVHLIEHAVVARPRLVGKLWRMLGEVQLSVGACGKYGRDAVESFAQGYGISLGVRKQLLVDTGRVVDQDGESSEDDEDAVIDSLTGRVGAMTISKSPIERFQSCLNESDALIGLTCSADKSALFFWRVSSQGTFTLQLQVPVDGPVSVNGVKQRLKDILDATKAMSTGSRALSAREKASWWKKRFKLDQQLGELLGEIEDQWFGECRSLLLPVSYVASSDPINEPIGAAYGAALCRFPALVNPAELNTVLDKTCCPEIGLDHETWAEAILKRAYVTSKCTSPRPARSNTSRTSTRSRRSAKSTRIDSSNPRDGSRPETFFGELLLALDQELEGLPWECLPILRSAKCGATRVLHQSFLTAYTAGESSNDVDASSVFYLLNPSGDLKSTQETFEETFEAQSGWAGGSGPGSGNDVGSNLSQLEVSDVFLYCGHGGAEDYIPPRRLARSVRNVPVSILMGCSSGRLQQFTDGATSSGTALEYILAGAPAVVSNLWDVSDRDIDRLTGSLLIDWLGVGRRSDESPSKACSDNRGVLSLARALAHARDACRLPFLVGAASIIYGRPRIRRLD